MKLSIHNAPFSLFHRFVQAKVLTRTLSAIVMIPITLQLIKMGGVIFNFAIIAISLLTLYEWMGIVMMSKDECECSINCEKIRYRWHMFGILICILFSLSMIFIRSYDSGFLYTMLLVISVWATDIGAYFAGIAIGGAKIAPNISPNKTWSGFIGGLFSACSVGLLLAKFHQQDTFLYLVLSLTISLASQIGDLLESKMKRIFKRKDSGSIIPGHGGILDRIDGLIAGSFFLSILLIFCH